MDRISRAIKLYSATVGPLGFIPFAPGTFGSLPGILIAWALGFFPVFYSSLILFFFFLFSVYVADNASKILMKNDPREIVIDETLGMTISLFSIKMNFQIMLLAFILFRFFDIVKPFPIRRLEHMFKGGVGIVIDDAFAGLMVNILIQLVIFLSG